MKIEALARPLPVCDRFAVPYSKQPESARPIQVSPRDLGYEIDEDELASELRAQQSDTLEDQATPEVDPDEFEPV